MPRQKSKKIRWEKQIGKMCPNYPTAKKIKEIDSNSKHKPKGHR